MDLLFFFFSNSAVVYCLGLLIPLVPVLLAVALLTLLERKVLGYMQFRKGPNLVGPLGILQPIADGMKLFIKENVKPSTASPFLYYLAPPVFFFLAFLLWGVVPLGFSILNVSLSLLFVIALSSLSVYGVLSAGWASNSKYAVLGALRAVAQSISYEVSFALILLSMVCFVGGWGLPLFFSAQSFSFCLVIPFFPLFFLWYISSLAETNRAPFDLVEGESELVSGYNVEYAGAPFALFFIGEYANIILMNVITSILFFGGFMEWGLSFWIIILSVIVMFFVFSFLWVRASFPRIRYDQLMMVMWKGFLPLSLSFLYFYLVFLVVLVGTPSFYF
uniref:NADH-ubiquinone oxidoreductase chain 1 n=1 Tax=Ophiomastix mixta TaxID=2705303 RepID=A0A6C0FFH1_9ECHI|nr:NADH dehydrogenase subunit 1 [Ophiomastix mixta]QHT54194.1 NADH dehydrogenase subunit 1 [Ophiomastix mixta]